MKKLITVFVTSLIVLTISAQSTQVFIRPKIESLVERLEKENKLHLGAPVGESGKLETDNKFYKLYKKLGSKATDEELVALTSNGTKLIAVYSFYILSSRGYSKLKEVFLEHINDTTEVWMAAGCTGSVDKVNSYMLRLLNPEYYPPGKAHFTKDEYNSYLALINKSAKQ